MVAINANDEQVRWGKFGGWIDLFIEQVEISDMQLPN